MLRRLFITLLALLRPKVRQGIRRGGTPLPLASHTRRYPGRTPVRDLRRNAGWIVDESNRTDRNRRA